MGTTMALDAVTLRLARADDARAMSAMSRDLIEVGLGWRYVPQRIRALRSDPDTVALVACQGSGAIAGFAIMQFGDETAHLVLMCVRQGQQRRGIGRRLVQWLLESARVAGIASVQLELRADNAGACAFYRALGFDATVLVPGYYSQRVAALRMQRVLRMLRMLRRPGTT